MDHGSPLLVSTEQFVKQVEASSEFIQLRRVVNAAIDEPALRREVEERVGAAAASVLRHRHPASSNRAGLLRDIRAACGDVAEMISARFGHIVDSPDVQARIAAVVFARTEAVSLTDQAAAGAKSEEDSELRERQAIIDRMRRAREERERQEAEKLAAARKQVESSEAQRAAELERARLAQVAARGERIAARAEEQKRLLKQERERERRGSGSGSGPPRAPRAAGGRSSSSSAAAAAAAASRASGSAADTADGNKAARANDGDDYDEDGADDDEHVVVDDHDDDDDDDDDGDGDDGPGGGGSVIVAPDGHEETVSEDEDGEVSCSCGQPWGGRAMIECDQCKVWYHNSCMLLAEDAVMRFWACPVCDPDSMAKRKKNGQGERAPKRRAVAPDDDDGAAPAVDDGHAPARSDGGVHTADEDEAQRAAAREKARAEAVAAGMRRSARAPRPRTITDDELMDIDAAVDAATRAGRFV